MGCVLQFGEIAHKTVHFSQWRMNTGQSSQVEPSWWSYCCWFSQASVIIPPQENVQVRSWVASMVWLLFWFSHSLAIINISINKCSYHKEMCKCIYGLPSWCDYCFGFPMLQRSLRSAEDEWSHLKKMCECVHGLPPRCDYCSGFPMLQRSLTSAEDECSHLKEMCESSQEELRLLATRYQDQLKEIQELQEKLQVSLVCVCAEGGGYVCVPVCACSSFKCIL